MSKAKAKNPPRGRKKPATKSRAASKPRKSAKSGGSRAAGQVASLCALGGGVFVFISLCFDVTGMAGAALRGFFFGLLGGGAFALPVFLVYAGVLGAMKAGLEPVKGRVLTALTAVPLVSTLVHVLAGKTYAVEGLIPALYVDGPSATVGGVAGGLLGMGLSSLFGQVGAVILIIFAMLVCAMVLTGVTLQQVLRFLFPGEFSRPGEEYEEYEDDGGPPPTRDEVTDAIRVLRRHKFNIDLPIDASPAKDRRGKAPSIDVPGPRETAPEPPVPVPVTARQAAPEPVPVGAASPAVPVQGLTFTSVATPAPKEPAPASPTPAPRELHIEKEGDGAHPYVFPPLSLLKQDLKNRGGYSADEVQQNSRKIVDTLRSFGVETNIINVSVGPTVTRYELQPSAGVKISKITSLSDDLALNLAAAGVRIEAPIPGKAAVGVEVPNSRISTVYIRDIIESPEFKNAGSRLSFAIGRDIGGSVVVGDIGKMPHMLIAGATGSGKSVCINSIITSLLYKARPDEVRLMMIDPKVVELGAYNGIPHLLVPVVTDPKKAAGALNWAVGEMLKRYKLFADRSVRDIRGYNEIAMLDDEVEPLCHIVIIIDELADLMMASPGEVEDAICRLAQMARAAGMHLVIATQRPSVDVITGTIKANIPSRVAFAVSSQVDSRTILDMGGAEKLLGKGDMLYYPVGAVKPLRVQGCFVTDHEVEAVTGYIKKLAQANYDDDVIEEIDRQADSKNGGGPGDDDGDDEMLPSAIEVAVEAGAVSVSMLQRRLKLGYARAARLVDQMEARGVVGPYEGAKPRQVLISRAQWQEMTMRAGDKG